MTQISKALTWDQLAEHYDSQRSGGRPARTLPMDTVFEWAENRREQFYVDPKEGTIHLIINA
jgi:hypothetical protein